MGQVAPPYGFRISITSEVQEEVLTKDAKQTYGKETKTRTHPKLRSSILSLRAQRQEGVQGEILPGLRPANLRSPADEGFANPGFELFLRGLSARLRALCVQLRFVGSFARR